MLDQLTAPQIMLYAEQHERSLLRRKLDYAQAIRAAALAGLDEGAQDDWQDFEANLLERLNEP